jgi:hypothetical protein
MMTFRRTFFLVDILELLFLQRDKQKVSDDDDETLIRFNCGAPRTPTQIVPYQFSREPDVTNRRLSGKSREFTLRVESFAMKNYLGRFENKCVTKF